MNINFSIDIDENIDLKDKDMNLSKSINDATTQLDLIKKHYFVDLGLTSKTLWAKSNYNEESKYSTFDKQYNCSLYKILKNTPANPYKYKNEELDEQYKYYLDRCIPTIEQFKELCRQTKVFFELGEKISKDGGIFFRPKYLIFQSLVNKNFIKIEIIEYDSKNDDMTIYLCLSFESNGKIYVDSFRAIFEHEREVMYLKDILFTEEPVIIRQVLSK